MCLHLDKNLKPNKATEDIVCYKFLHKVVDKSFIAEDSYDGKEFTGVIKNIEITGILVKSYVKDSDYTAEWFLCTNDRRFDGAIASNKKGYLFSWIIDSSVQSVIVDGKELIDLSKAEYYTPYQNAPVKIGETYSSEFRVQDREVYEGLHSFANIEDPRKDSFSKSFSKIIVKCIIPAGSNYYEGRFNGSKSYASDKLKYVEIVNN